MRAAAPLIARTFGQLADHRNSARTLQRQHTVFVFEQDHAFPGDFAGEGMMLFPIVRSVLHLLRRSAQNDAQNAPDRRIQLIFRQRTALDRIHDLFRADSAA